MLRPSWRQPCQGFSGYARGNGTGVAIKAEPDVLEIGKAEMLRDGGDIVIWAIGPFVHDALKLANKLQAEQGLSVGVVNARFIKPLDTELLFETARNSPLIVTMEDHAVTGGFGTAVVEALSDEGLATAVERIGWPDRFVEHGSSNADLRAANGLSPADIEARILRRHTRALQATATAQTIAFTGLQSE